MQGPKREAGGATTTAPAPTEPAPPAPVAAPEPPRRRTPRASRILFALVAVLTLIETVAFAGTYLGYSRHYVSTDNAQVDGDAITINAPATGVVTDWRVDQGSAVRRDQIVGRITIQGSKAQPQNLIRSPGAGTVAMSNVVDGEYVQTGAQLATAYDYATIYVTARIEEDDIARVRLGAPVDITADAFSHVPVTGVVTEIQGSAAGQFTIYPSPDIDPTNPQKVDQYVPVKIAFTRTGGAALAPGMNVTVHIHADR